MENKEISKDIADRNLLLTNMKYYITKHPFESKQKEQSKLKLTNFKPRIDKFSPLGITERKIQYGTIKEKVCKSNFERDKEKKKTIRLLRKYSSKPKLLDLELEIARSLKLQVKKRKEEKYKNLISQDYSQILKSKHKNNILVNSKKSCLFLEHHSERSSTGKINTYFFNPHSSHNKLNFIQNNNNNNNIHNFVVNLSNKLKTFKMVQNNPITISG